MDFNRYDTDPELASFIAYTRDFFTRELGPDRIAGLAERRDENDQDFLRALGREGWIMPGWDREQGGAGLDRQHQRILKLEMARAAAPTINLSTTRTILPAVLAHGSPELAARVVAEATAGEACIAMGYSEPEGGSDIAAAKTSARRDGDGWVISGQKVFTTGAQHCRYVFLLTRTDPAAAKHAGLTMFLVPLDSPGIEVRPLATLDERTNVMFLDEVRVTDEHLVGAPGEGWRVLLGPLNEEHGVADERSIIDAGQRHGLRLADALEAALAWAQEPTEVSTARQAAGTRPMDDPRVRDELAELGVQLLAACSVWGHAGRLAAAEAYLTGVGRLTRLVGAAATVPGHAWDTRPASRLEYHRRTSQVSTIYGGSVEVIRDVVAVEMGLPRWSTR